MASMVLLNIIYWLPRETTNSLIYEGGTQNEGNIMSIAADHLADYYTNAKVQRLPLTYKISPSGLFRGRALKYQLPMKAFDFLSISVLDALWQSHLRLRGSERISGMAQIRVSISIGAQRSKLRTQRGVLGVATCNWESRNWLTDFCEGPRRTRQLRSSSAFSAIGTERQ